MSTSSIPTKRSMRSVLNVWADEFRIHKAKGEHIPLNEYDVIIQVLKYAAIHMGEATPTIPEAQHD